MLSEEKFAEKANEFCLVKNTDNAYFTIKEYYEKVKDIQVDKDGNPKLSELEQLDLMIDLVADSIFKRVEEVTPEAILDGIEGDKLTDVLQEVIMGAMGITEEDIEAAEEGK